MHQEDPTTPRRNAAVDQATHTPPDLLASHICWAEHEARAATWVFVDDEDGDGFAPIPFRPTLGEPVGEP